MTHGHYSTEWLSRYYPEHCFHCIFLIFPAKMSRVLDTQISLNASIENLER